MPLIADLLSGMFCASDDTLQNIIAKLPDSIDAIHAEQPWLWPLVVAIKKIPQYANAISIYGSQNVEAPLKHDILNSYKVPDFADVIDAIDSLEKQAAREADLSVAVTQTEADTLTQWGAKKTLLLQNGIEPWSASESDLDKWRGKLPKYPWLLYVASAHPPNFSHFSEIFGGTLGCFSPINRLVVAGSVSEHIYAEINKPTRFRDLNISRLQLLFILSDNDLAAVKTLAHGFILPIPFGGGSNIKTAEALYSGAHVIGTPSAFRGFDKFRACPEVREAPDPKSLHKSIREVLSLPKRDRSSVSDAGREMRDTLRWDVCLSPLPVAAERLVTERALPE